jgi:hypothetical protein
MGGRLALVLCVLTAVLAGSSVAHAEVSFAPYFTVDGGAAPLGLDGYVATGDFNQDGDPDLAVARRAGGDVAVMLGGPGATFGQLTAYDVDGSPLAITVGNFDGNADPDLATVDPNTDNVSVLLGSTGGTFVGSGPYSVGGDFNAIGITSGNLDPGGDPEIVTANAFGDNVSVLPGAAGGTFGTAEPHAASDASYDPLVADFNGDGDPEIAASGDDTVVLVGGTGRSFGAATPVDPGGALRGRGGLAAGDFDSDGDPDLAVGRKDFRDVVALRGAAGATFGGPNSLGLLNTLGGTPEHTEIADLDGDGDPEIAETAGNVWVMVGGAGASFAAPVEFPTDTASSSIIRTGTRTWCSAASTARRSGSCSTSPPQAAALAAEVPAGAAVARLDRRRSSTTWASRC